LELEVGVLIEDENQKFKIDIVAVGTYVFDINIEPDTLDKYFYINAPAIIFPYIRAYISSLTALSGLKPINLPTLNLSNLGSELKTHTVLK
jgi:preprotein translocase subunit SecB